MNAVIRPKGLSADSAARRLTIKNNANECARGPWAAGYGWLCGAGRWAGKRSSKRGSTVMPS
jgi:hypothetical protein